MSWTSFENCSVKAMKYVNSCFPCALHMGLVNIGLCEKSRFLNSNWVEDYFNNKIEEITGRDLNIAAPTVDTLKNVLDMFLTEFRITNDRYLYQEQFRHNDNTYLEIANSMNHFIITSVRNNGGHAQLVIMKDNVRYYINNTKSGIEDVCLNSKVNVLLGITVIDNMEHLLVTDADANILTGGDQIFAFK